MKIVIGMPLLLDGKKGKQSKAVRAFLRMLEEKTDLPIIEWDERFTTTQAKRALADSGMTQRRRKKQTDTVAAQLILQSYLDSLPGALDVYREVDVEDIGPMPDSENPKDERPGPPREA